ncbi:hypothetical protein FDECE_9627 [Fusarium decemcellulare]|nr:hypothetical protein FDECE_9627 [Fusarium decemcellulare]
MLHPSITEDTLWTMRAWLLHWYEVAEALFRSYGIFATTPNPDWFKRPLAKPIKENQPGGHIGVRQRDKVSSPCSSSLSDTGTVIHRHPLRSLVLESEEDTRELQPTPASPNTVKWLDSQSEMIETNGDGPILFDPTPRGRISRKRRQVGSPMSQTPSPSPPTSKLNPLATEFVPSFLQGPESGPDRCQDDVDIEDLFESCSNFSQGSTS